jgi:hypothetical protein
MIHARTLLLGGLLLVAGCNSRHDTFRAVFLTDTHIIGPQYTTPVENSPSDNSSIMKTVERLTAVRETINAMKPAPAMVFISGDIVHAAHRSMDPQWYRDNVNAYSVAADLFKGFAMPVYMVMGNHDYELDCATSTSYTREFSEARFKEFFGQDPWSAVDYGGWKFLLVNSQRGPTFDVNGTDCRTEFASVGTEQMNWADQQLGEGKPSVVMSHFMRILYDHVETGANYDSFPGLLDAHPNALMFLTGHTHRWLDMSGFNNYKPHWVLGGTRYDANNFWTVEFEQGSDQFKILDQDKAIQYSSCANQWTYDGTPKPAANPVETGDCVSKSGD